jgi:hypothetical protein
MNNIIFYLIKENTDEIKLEELVYPTQYTDVMDGSFDTGSAEFIINLNDYLLYKDKELREGEFIRRRIIVDNEVVDDTIYIIDEVNAEKDSVYNENKIKLTIKYIESTKYLTDLLIANHTYSVTPIIWSNSNKASEKNSLYDVFKKSYDMLGERNNIFNIETNSYRKFTINKDLENILKKYPNKNRTYLDCNFFDVCKENFADISSVPYYDVNNRELSHISSMGKDTNKTISIYRDNIVVSSSYNRDKSNNCDVIENKAVNIYEDYESIWYPNNIPLDDFQNEDMKIERRRASNYARPKGLNEGLESYQYWYNWYLELPFNIERIEKLYYINLDGTLTNDGAVTNANTFKDVTDRVIEQKMYNSLTDTEKKKFAYYKKGSNKINAISVASGITTENDIWPWDRTSDNQVAFKGMFAVKYKPIINSDVTIIKNGKRKYNKKNIAFSNKDISDSDLISRTKYELEKNSYGQYMLEIAGKYQNISAGELVDIEGFEHYGIPSKKYLIYKVNTTFEKEGSHQIIYFNEMVSKNNVLLNENNLVRISQNPSSQSSVERVFKRTDLIGIKSELVDGKEVFSYDPGDNYCGNNFAFNSLKNILNPDSNSSNNIKGILFGTRFLKLDDYLKEKQEYDETWLIGSIGYLNAGTVSQAFIKAIDNCIWDNKYNAVGVTPGGPDDFELIASLPVRYTDAIGQFELMNAWVLNSQMKKDSTSDYTAFLFNEYPLASKKINERPTKYEDNILFSLAFGNKDMREIMQIVYEQSWYGVDDNVQLTDYFTSCTSSFSGELSMESKITSKGGKLNKIISIYDKKIYNINGIDEPPIKSINYTNYHKVVSFDGNSIYIKLKNTNGTPFKGQVGEFVDEYSISINGVSNYNLNEIKQYDDENDIITGSEFIYSYQRYVPQIFITVPAHIVKDEEYIKLTIETNKL